MAINWSRLLKKNEWFHIIAEEKNINIDINAYIMEIDDSMAIVMKEDNTWTGIDLSWIRFIEPITNSTITEITKQDNPSIISDEQSTELPASRKQVDNESSHLENSGNSNKVMSISDYYGKILDSAKSLIIEDEYTLSSIKDNIYFGDNSHIKNSLLGIFNSLNYAISKDPNNIDAKVSESIQKIHTLYTTYKVPELLIANAYIHTLYTTKHDSSDINFYNGIKAIIREEKPEIALRFLLANGKIPDVLSVWREYYSAPQYLIKVFNNTPYVASADNNAILNNYIEQIIASPVHDIKGKNLLLYAIYCVVAPNHTPIDTFVDDPQLPMTLKKEIKDAISLFGGKGMVVLTTSKKLISKEMRLYTYDDTLVKASMGDYVYFIYDEKTSICRIEKILKHDDRSFSDLKRFINGISTSIHPDLKNVILQCRYFIDSLTSYRNSSYYSSSEIKKDKKRNPQKSSPDDYAKISITIQNARTYEERLKAIAVVEQYIITYGAKLNAVNDLIALYLRRPYQDYDKAIEIYQKYRGELEKNEDSKLKLYRIVVTAFIGKGVDAIARDMLIFILSKHPSSPDYVRLAKCYINLHDYDNALDCCDKAENQPILATPDFVSLIICRFATYFALGEYNLARDALEKGKTINFSKKQQMIALLEESKTDVLSKEEREQQIKDILQLVTSTQNYSIDDLYEPYFKAMIDECQFDQIRDRKYDEETKKWVWIPQSSSISFNIYESLRSNSSYFFPNSERLRPGVMADSARKCLNMAKVAEATLLKSTEWQMDQEQTDLWRSKFICSSARYLWLVFMEHYKNSGGQHGDIDSDIFFLKECICMYLKSTDAVSKYDFYHAVNMFLVFIVKPSISRDFPIRRDSSMTAAERKSLEFKTYETIKNCWKKDESKTIKALGLLAGNNFLVADYISSLIINNGNDELPFVQSILDGVKEKINGLSKSRTTEISSLNSALLQYGGLLTSNREKIKEGIKQLIEAISTLNPHSITLGVKTIEGFISNEDECYLLETDVLRCRRFIALVGGEKDSLINLVKNVNNYEVGQNNYIYVKSNSNMLLQEINANPAEISYLYLINGIKVLLDVAEELNNKLLKNSEPIIVVENEYEEEGYLPVNNTLEAMLLISNGRKGENCTTASRMTLDIHENEGLEKYCILTKCHFDILEAIGRGEQKSVKIPLLLSKEGTIPDSVLPFSFSIRYQTISGKQEKKDYKFNLRIKSDKEFIPVKNLYSEDSIQPGSERSGLFKGRDKDIENICNDLTSSRGGRTVLIYGQFRSGKSTLKNFVVNKLKQADNNYIIADAKTVTTGESASTIVKRIIKTICKQMVKQQYTVDRIESYRKEKIDNDYLTENNYFEELLDFTAMLKECMEEIDSLRDIRILVVLDEFGRFLENKESRRFIESWKAVMEIGAFNAIFIGHDIVTQMMRIDMNAFGVIRLRRVDYIDKQSAVELIVNPTFMHNQHKSRFTEEAVNYIWKESGGNVYYIQLICSQLVVFMNKRGINVLNDLYVKEALNQWIDSLDGKSAAILGHPLFKSGEIEENGGVSDNMAIIVLDALCSTDNNNKGCTLNDITRYISTAYPYNLSNDEIMTAISSLESRKVIDTNKGRYCVRSKFYRDYLNHKIVSSVKLTGGL